MPGAAEALIQVLADLGIHFEEGPIPHPTNSATSGEMYHLQQIGDHGPYIQSQRTELYRKYALELVAKGHAYYCFATATELEEMRNAQIAAGLAPMYDRRALNLTPEEVNSKLEAGLPYVIRLKMPRDRIITFHDQVRGKVSFLGKEIDDQILIKSDGLPTYHLANVVDDHLMAITHVIRAEEWLPSTPKHLFMYEAFGWQAPTFAHLPLILNADKSKLSKRQNDVSVESYLQKGYTKEALLNYVALLGWHPGKGIEQEIFTLNQLIEGFQLEHVHKAGAVFDLEKLDWFNWQWQKINYYKELDNAAIQIKADVQINILPSHEHTYTFATDENQHKFEQARSQILLQKATPHLVDEIKSSAPSQLLLRALLVNEEKIIKNPSQTNDLIGYFYQPIPLNPELLLNSKMGVTDQNIAQNSLQFAKNVLEKLPAEADLNAIKDTFLTSIKATEQKNGTVLWPLRVALTHLEFSVGAFEAIWVLGKEESLKRLDQALEK